MESRWSTNSINDRITVLSRRGGHLGPREQFFVGIRCVVTINVKGG